MHFYTIHFYIHIYTYLYTYPHFITDSTRLLFATWWIFITILTSFYTANLTAFLTLSKFTLPFNSVDDIARREKHFVAQRGGGIEYAIKNVSKISYIQYTYLNKIVQFSINQTIKRTLVKLYRITISISPRILMAPVQIILKIVNENKKSNRCPLPISHAFSVIKE